MFRKEAVLSVSNIRKVFEGRKSFTAVDGVSFDIKAGEIVGLLGPNGAGKSTTIQMLLGTMRPTSGEITYFGRDFFRNRSAVLAQVGYVNGYSRLPWNLSVFENLQVHGRLYGMGLRERLKGINALLDSFGAGALKHKLMHQLSAGEATRVVLARAFLPNPRLVLLDEPTAALDPAICREVIDFIRDQRRLREVSMLYTSHNMAEVAELCDRVVFLKQGRVLACGTPRDLAATLASARLKLGLTKRTEDLQIFLAEKCLPWQLRDNWLEVSLKQDAIPDLLAAMGARGLGFSGIEIEKPSLEDYFVSVSKGA